MTRVSRYPLTKNIESQMHMLFRRAIIGLKSEEDVADFLNDLLTPTEKVMLGKRLAIAVLLDDGYDFRAIQRIMHVSTATVASVSYWLKNQGKGYRKVIQKIKNDEQWVKMVQDIADTLKKLTPSGLVREVYRPKMPSDNPKNSLI